MKTESPWLFADRSQAAKALIEPLRKLHLKDALLFGIPRGSIPMTRIISDALKIPMDIIFVHKISLPQAPEFAVASVSEEGDLFYESQTAEFHKGDLNFRQLALDKIQEMKNRRKLYGLKYRRIDLSKHDIVIVDDGIATGATVKAAIKSLQHRHANRIIVATPVASPEAIENLRALGAEVMALYAPKNFYAVGQFYHHFPQVTDIEVIHAIQIEQIEFSFSHADIKLNGFIISPSPIRQNLKRRQASPKGVIIFAHGSGSGRHSPRNQFVAHQLCENGYVSVLADLLSEAEALQRSNVFDISLLANRLLALTEWVRQQTDLTDLPMSYFGASTGAAAALQASVLSAHKISAIVSRGGRPDLAYEYLSLVRSPTLFIVGGQDHEVLELNKNSQRQMTSAAHLEIIENATHLFEESGALEKVSHLARKWFDRYMLPKSEFKKSRTIKTPKSSTFSDKTPSDR